MIKFRYLIHKETGTVIKYEDWKEGFEKGFLFRFRSGNKVQKCDAVALITSYDFEIIYDPEFTLEELGIIFRGNHTFINDLMSKIDKTMKSKELLKSKYGIEV